MTVDDPYLLRRLRPEDAGSLRALAREVWPERPGNIFSDRWWLREEPPSALVGIDRASGEIAGILADRSCRFEMDGKTIPASGICDWYLSTRHAGRGLGKRLMSALVSGYDLVVGISPTEVSHANLKKLGFGPVFEVPGYLAPVPSAWAAARLRSRVSSIRVFDVDLRAPGDVPPVIDEIWARSDSAGTARLVRDCAELRWRIRLGPARGYRVFIAERAGMPAGYLLARVGPRGTSNRLPWTSLGLLVDFLTVDASDAATFAALLERALAWFARCRAPFAVGLTTVPAFADAMTRVGFVSRTTPILGTHLAKLGTRFTYRFPMGHTNARPFHFTFADADLDLSLGAILEARTAEAGRASPKRTSS